MSGTANAPPLNASGTDPVIDPPPPPPIDASNSPSDRARGVPGEASADDLAVAARARRGEQTVASPDAPSDRTPAATTKTGDDDPALDADGKPLLDADGLPLRKPDFSTPQQKAAFIKERNRRNEADAARKAADDRAEAAQKRLDEALESLKALTPKPPPEPIAEPRPQREAFVSPEAYDEAIEAWATRNAEIAASKARTETEQAAKAAAERASREAAERQQADFIAKTETAWKDRRDKAAAEIPDFAEFAESDAVQITDVMGFTIKTAENGPQIAYHLGKNPSEAARIAALPMGQQAFEMGKLSATLAQPVRSGVSRAPAPITPLSGTSEVASTDREESMAEVAARVRKRDAYRPAIAGSRPN